MSDHETSPDNLHCNPTNTDAKCPDPTCINATESNKATPDEPTPDVTTPENTISDAKRRANQENARKSTGPKTEQGKAKARRNALKHGMTSDNEHLFSSDAQLYKNRLESWIKTAKPANDMELYQIESAVRATVNLDRCARNETAKRNRRERSAAGRWAGVQTKKINRAIAHWSTQPAACVAQLRTFTRGCEWLLNHWEGLAEVLEKNECWTGEELKLAMRLLGKCPEMFHDGDREVAAFRTLVVGTLPEMEPDEMDRFLGIDTSQLEPEARKALFVAKLPSHEDALEGLWATLNAELERLEAIREKLWDRTDGPAFSEKMDLVAFDDSKNGVLRRRYESANHLDLHRCLKQFTEQRNLRDGRLEEDRQLEEKAKAEAKAERDLAFRKAAYEYREARRLQNEANASEAKDNPISTSGKSGDVDPRPNTAPEKSIQKVSGPTEAGSEGSQASEPTAPGASEAQKPS
jgi:hypothetical protein